MVQIDGTYQFVENINAVEFIKATGKAIDEKALSILKDTSVKVTVKLEGDKCTITSSAGANFGMSFTFGQTFDDVLPFGYTLKTVAKKDGNRITLSSVGETLAGDRYYDFTDSGLTITFNINNSDVTAKRVYKRV